jgi:hypothetical protein
MFINEAWTKIKIKKNNVWKWNTKNKENQCVLFKRERENKKKISMTKCLYTIVTCHTNKKKTQRHFQRNNKKASLATEKHYIHCSKDMDVSHMLAGALHPPITFWK